MILTDEQYIKVFNKFRKEFTCTASDSQLKKWGHSNKAIRLIKIEMAKSIIKLREDGIRLKIFIDSIVE